MLIDTHCHLDFPIYDERRPALLALAQSRGVAGIVVPAVTADHFQRVLDCATSPAPVSLWTALGLHPCFMSEHTNHSLAKLEQSLSTQRGQLVAVGEIGLDFRIDDSAIRQHQIELFEAQLTLAKAANLPVLLHVVKAHDQVLKRLRQWQLPCAGIVHAFSGSEQQAKEYLKLGFKLGFGGAVSYSRANKLRRLVAELPLDALVLETDAPDMPLSDWRGHPNEPQRVADVARILAQLRGQDEAELIAATGRNAQQLLKLDQMS